MGAVSASDRVTLRPAGSVPGAKLKLGYIEYLPPGYGKGAKRPLLIFLHGLGEAGKGSAAQLRRVWKLGIPQLIRTKHWPGARPFVVLMPQYSVPAAQDCRLADELAEFVRFASRRYAVDVHGIYLTGISCGAIGVWDYLSAHAGKVVAGAVPISGHAVDAFAGQAAGSRACRSGHSTGRATTSCRSSTSRNRSRSSSAARTRLRLTYA